MIEKITPVQRCHSVKCGEIKPAHSYAVVKRYGREIIDYYCEECTIAILSNPESRLRRELIDIEPTAETRPTKEPKIVAPKKTEEKKEGITFLTSLNFERLNVTPRGMVLEALDGAFTNRGTINKRISKTWGGILRTKVLTATIKMLTEQGRIECLVTSRRDSLCRLAQAKPSTEPKLPNLPDLIRGDNRLHLSCNKLKEHGITVDALVLEQLDSTPKNKTIINKGIFSKYGARLSNAVIKRALKTLISIECVERIPHLTKKEVDESYRLAKRFAPNSTPTQNV